MSHSGAHFHIVFVESLGDLENENHREIAYGADVPLALGDEYILNTGTLQDAFRDLEAIIERRRPISG